MLHSHEGLMADLQGVEDAAKHRRPGVLGICFRRAAHNAGAEALQPLPQRVYIRIAVIPGSARKDVRPMQLMQAPAQMT